MFAEFGTFRKFSIRSYIIVIDGFSDRCLIKYDIFCRGTAECGRLSARVLYCSIVWFKGKACKVNVNADVNVN